MKELSAKTAEVHTKKEACKLVANTIADSGKWDIPFAVLYLFNDKSEKKQLFLVEAVGIERNTTLTAEIVELDSLVVANKDLSQLQPAELFAHYMGQVAQTSQPQEVKLSGFQQIGPCGGWNEAPK